MKGSNRLTRVELKNLERATQTRVHGAFFSMSIFPLRDSKTTKYTCVISKKTARHAVDRNRAKRRCRALLKDGLREVGPFACIVHIKSSALKASYEDLRRDIDSIVRKIATSYR